MFDFEKLDIYYRAKQFYSDTKSFCKNSKVDSISKGQLLRASFSIILNIAEGSGRFSKPDRRNFFVIARSSIFECVAIFDVLKDEGVLSKEKFKRFYDESEELSKILFALIKGLSK
jgi:four helix bundle protein